MIIVQQTSFLSRVTIKHNNSPPPLARLPRTRKTPQPGGRRLRWWLLLARHARVTARHALVGGARERRARRVRSGDLISRASSLTGRARHALVRHNAFVLTATAERLCATGVVAGVVCRPANARDARVSHPTRVHSRHTASRRRKFPPPRRRPPR